MEFHTCFRKRGDDDISLPKLEFFFDFCEACLWEKPAKQHSFSPIGSNGFARHFAPLCSHRIRSVNTLSHTQYSKCNGACMYKNQGGCCIAQASDVTNSFLNVARSAIVCYVAALMRWSLSRKRRRLEMAAICVQRWFRRHRTKKRQRSGTLWVVTSLWDLP